MKFSLAIISLLAVFSVSKSDASSSPNYDETYKKVADTLEQFAKKFEELSGYKTEFDKEKFFNFLKSTTQKLNDEFKTFSEKLQKDSKAVPEEIKKKYDELVKQINETVKGLSSPDVQNKAQELQKTFNSSVKKIAEQVNDLSKSFGLNVPPSVQKTFNEIYDEIAKTATKISEKSQKILEGIQEELKKKKP